MSKGFWSIAEAAIAIVLIFSFLFALMPGLAKKQHPDPEVAYSALGNMDIRDLRKLSEAYDYGAIADRISVSGFRHSVEVCGYSGCKGEIPEGEAYVATKVLAGYSSYSPRLVKVYVFR